MALYNFVQPFLMWLNPETAHHLALRALEHGLVPAQAQKSSSRLTQRLLGLTFPNPVGLAAGFDKNAQAVLALMRLGFGFVEAGTLTPRPQAGNPRPRLFRLKRERAVINRMGFNNNGAAAAAERLKILRRSHRLPAPLGINIGANKDSIDRIGDYGIAFRQLYDVADYITVNISSPNTPGLRTLQEPEALARLIARLVELRAELAALTTYKPVLVKIAPDMSMESATAIADLARVHGIDGLIISNTTVTRPTGLSTHAHQEGGLSGAPLFDASTRLLGALYLHVGNSLPLIGVGGISNAQDAYDKICAGASLVQMYTALVFKGPALVGEIIDGLEKCLIADGYPNIGKAVGTHAYDWAHGKARKHAG